MMIGVLVGCSYLIGEYISKAYTNRHKEVNELIRILEIMRMDLSFGLYTLEEVFKRIGNKTDFYTSKFFTKLSLELRDNPYKTLNQVMDDSLDILRKETYLNDKEVEELKELIITLGKSDIESQSRMIELAIANLKSITIETKEEIEKKGVIYKKLSTIVGLMIGIILI